MEVARDDLTVLFNRLFDRGDGTFAVSHPADELDPLLTVELRGHDDCVVRFDTDRDAYDEAISTIRPTCPETVSEDLPSPDEYVKAVVSSGVVPIANHDEVANFIDRHGDPDLMAGHPPVVVGLDTNLVPWRIDEILGLRDPEAGVGYVNGFVLATGIRDELDWDFKCHDTDPFVERFGNVYEEYWNQPLGSARIGRLGMQTYRKIRDIDQADEIESDTGDEAIVDAYDRYDDERRSQILLLSNDRNFIERATGHTILGQHVEFPRDLPRKATASWRDIEHLLYALAVVFGIVEVPTTTVYGVWRGKAGHDWRDQRVKLDCRSTTLEPKLEADLSIVDSYEELEIR